MFGILIVAIIGIIHILVTVFKRPKKLYSFMEAYGVLVVTAGALATIVFAIHNYTYTHEECEADPECTIEVTERYHREPNWFSWPFDRDDYKEREDDE